MTPRKIKRYGWRPSRPDMRDLHYFARPSAPLPPRCDLRGLCPPVYDQLALGSCTSNAWAFAVQFLALKEALSDQTTPSRLFIYWNERVLEGSTGTDSGAELRDGIKTLATIGSISETEWPYDIAKFADEPPAQCFTDAKVEKTLRYMAVRQAHFDLKSALASGYPVPFGFTVYESFESAQVAKTGLVPMPGMSESVVGGHAVALVGYDDDFKAADGQPGCYVVRNSWSDTWGDAGYFYMPYRYVGDPDLASDFWVAQYI